MPSRKHELTGGILSRSFNQLHVEVLRRGILNLIDAPKTEDKLIILAGSILSEASTAAYWATGDGLHDMIGLKVSPSRSF